MPNSAFFRGELSDDLSFCARLKLKTGRPNEAEDAYREAIALWDDVAEVFRHDHVRELKIALINLLRNTGRANEALLIANELPGRDAEDLLARARTYETLEDHTRALADHQQAIRLQEKLAVDFPNEPERRAQLNSGYALLGELLQRTGKLDDAEQCFRKAVALSEELTTEFAAEAYYWRQYYDSHVRLAKLLAAMGRPDEASVCFREAIRICRDVSQCNNLAWGLATSPDTKLRDPAAAVEGARKATELEPYAGSCWNTLGVALYRNGDWAGAVSALEKSMHSLDGDCGSWNYFFLAMAHWQLGHNEEAQKRFRQAVEWMDKNQPDDEELRRFRKEAEALLGVNDKQE